MHSGLIGRGLNDWHGYRWSCAIGNRATRSVQDDFGEVNQILALNLEHDTNPDLYVQRVLQAIQSVDEGDGVLVLVDLLGGSPGNAVAYSLATIGVNGEEATRAGSRARPRAMAVTGVNLPMLLEALGSREVYSLDDLVPVVMAVGRDGVENLNSLLNPLP